MAVPTGMGRSLDPSLLSHLFAEPWAGLHDFGSFTNQSSYKVITSVGTARVRSLLDPHSFIRVIYHLAGFAFVQSLIFMTRSFISLFFLSIHCRVARVAQDTFAEDEKTEGLQIFSKLENRRLTPAEKDLLRTAWGEINRRSPQFLVDCCCDHVKFAYR